MSANCFHCGLPVEKRSEIRFHDHLFCCVGCRNVYEILDAGGLQKYYELSQSPGASPPDQEQKYDFLGQPQIVSRLLEFDEGGISIASLHIPHIHCSSCIWILENLHRLDGGIRSAEVNFIRKSVRIVFSSEETSLREIVSLLCRIGYEPYISLEQYDAEQKKKDRSQIFKLGVAFFSFGNIMLLSFPEYFELDEFWLNQYRGFFRVLIFLLALPSFLYSASGYYRAAWQAVRNRNLNIEVPIALGLIVMFIRSTFDMWLDHGPGFFDSLSALVFFMLLGRMFQAKTYDFLNFERDYKSYFPIAITRIQQGKEENVPVYDILPGDRLLLRQGELIPADGILISPEAAIDYSFVSGEALPVRKVSGDTIFAGGRQTGGLIEMEALKPVSQSYLTSLWARDDQKSVSRQPSITDRVSRIFTPVLLLIAVAGWVFWSFRDLHTAFNVFTAVLIVACPCALALTAPFTHGNLLRILGRHRFYVKDTAALERMASLDTIVLDKTGTITQAKASRIRFTGEDMTSDQLAYIRSLARNSNHPLSRMLYQWLPESEPLAVEDFSETSGGGISGTIHGCRLLLGGAGFVGAHSVNSPETRVYLSIDAKQMGHFTFGNRYRPGMRQLFEALGDRFGLHLLSGDNEGEKHSLQALLPRETPICFNQKPDQKRSYISNLQKQGSVVAMVGDGLNDAGALSQSDLGIAVSENVNLFSPACDVIVDASVLDRLDRFLKLSRDGIRIIKISFAMSLLYNVVGLSFALAGKLDPLMAAILMPLSTITIVSFTTLAGNFQARKLGRISSEKEPATDKYHVLGESPKVILTQ